MQAQPWPKEHSPAVVKPFLFPQRAAVNNARMEKIFTTLWPATARVMIFQFATDTQNKHLESWFSSWGREGGGGASRAFARVGSGWKPCWLKVNFCVISSALNNTAHFVSGWMSKNWNESQMFFHFFRLLFSTDCRLWCLSKKPALEELLIFLFTVKAAQ